MKMFAAGLCAALLLLACSADKEELAETAPDTSQDVFSMPYTMRDLDNGLRVIIVPTDYPNIVSMQIPVQTGSRNEVEPGKSGFAHFFEHMMFRGTEKYSAEEYLNILTKAGAKQNAYTTDDYTNYYIDFSKDDLEKMIEIEADRFMNLSYSESVFRTEALAVKGEYLKNFSNPTSQAYERIRELAFKDHTYRHTTMGFIEDIEQMPEQFEYSKTFFDRWYRPEKTAMILVGDVDPEATFKLVEKYWGEWQRGNYTASIPAEKPLQGPVFDHLQWDAPTQSWLMMGFRGPAFDPAAADMPAIDVISSIYFSSSSELYRKLVLDEQSVDQLFTYFPDRKDPNLLLVYARLTEGADASAVEAAINQTLATARSSLVAPARLADTKSRLKYEFTSTLDNSGAIGAMLAGYVQFDRTPETVNTLYRSYDALTAEQIRDVANRYFTDDRRVTVTLSNGTALGEVDGMASIDDQVDVSDAEADAAAFAEEKSAPLPELPVPAEDIAREDVAVEILTQPSPSSPLVDVSFLVHAGAAMDPPNKRGLAALTAAMVADAGSIAMTIEEINKALYPIAARFDAQVDKEMTRFAGQVHRDNFALWYQLVAGQLLTPGWRQQDFARVRTQLINSVRTSLVGNNDEELGKEVLYEQIFGAQHPYGALNEGHTADLAALSLADVQSFYREHYTIKNMTVGLAGGYPDEFAGRLAKDLQILPTGERRKSRIATPAELARNRAVIVEKETPAVAVSFGFPIDLKRGDDDWVALWLVRSWLGEHRNAGGRLYDRIRETRGMNYGDYVYIEYFPRGMFLSYPDTNLGRQQQIFQIWLRPLRSNNDAHFATRTALYELENLIQNGMNEQEFENTRSYLSKYVSLMMDGQSRRLGYALDSRYYGIEEFDRYLRNALNELTLADVNRVIRGQLRTHNLQYVFVSRNASDLRDRLSANRPSPMNYDSEMPQVVLDEDRKIQELPIPFVDEAITVVEAAAVFR
ncbi:MAG: insulinase family protein [Woeseia sp.]|nr:insulinase family protein [Woeseia sp.]